MSVSLEVRETAAKAADVIRRRGWYQGAFMGPGNAESCPVCVGGAVNVAAGGTPDCPDGAAWRVYSAIVTVTGGKEPDECWWEGDFIDAVAAWNDDPARTVDEVLAVLDAIAADTEAAAA